VDQRVLDTLIDREISVGDYVLTGGELPALALVDAVSRFIPGVLGNDDAHADETFEGGMLEYPQYTRPAQFRGMAVPGVLLTGHHANITAWRGEQSLKKTQTLRPDLIGKNKE
jgi:tRNA (guanine37-N1)-methyltransferase